MRILKDLDHELEGRDVLLVEDIVDSGLTLNYLLKNLRHAQARDPRGVALLRRKDIQQVDDRPPVRGFEIPQEFVVGYGLDFAERYRNLPYIAHPEARGVSRGLRCRKPRALGRRAGCGTATAAVLSLSMVAAACAKAAEGTWFGRRVGDPRRRGGRTTVSGRVGTEPMSR